MKHAFQNYAAVILAAGESTRFGSPKILLEWEGEPLIHYLCRKTIEIGLSPVCLILGAYIKKTREIVNDLPVEVIINSRWQDGMSQSFKCGVTGLPVNCHGALMILADQPYLDNHLISTLISATAADVVIPTYKGEKGHPVLWRKKAFSQIQKLKPHQPPREALKNINVKYVEWENPLILKDIDTAEDYSELKNLFNNLWDC